MEEAITPEGILRLLLVANGPVTISAEKVTAARSDNNEYQVAISYEPFKDEFTIHLVESDGD